MRPPVPGLYLRHLNGCGVTPMRVVGNVRRVWVALITGGALLSSGCAGVGFVATSDPHGKLAQAGEMMNEDRCQLAELTIGDAMKIFQEHGDQRGIADAHFQYGLLYKNRCYHEGKSSAQFRAAGTYDGTYGKSLDQLQQALKIYDAVGDDLGVVNSLSSIAEVRNLRSERGAACSSWDAALARYRSGKASGSIANDRVSTPGYNNMGEVIEAYLHRDCPTASPSGQAPG